jgi:hypothetical protein
MNTTPAPTPIEKPCLLIGEGVEEVRFFTALLKHLGIQGVQVEQCAGKRVFKKYFSAQAVRSGFDRVDSIVIVQDADDNPDGTLASVCETVRVCGLTPPSRHADFSDGRPRVGVFIMPDGSRPGMLESLCVDSVAEDAAMECVRDFLECVRDRCGRVPSPIEKAQTHAWLASRAAPDKRLGEAAEAGYWPWDHAAFMGLVEFLRRI